MGLEKQFLPYCDNEYANKEDNASNCAEIAENFAIGFALWMLNTEYDLSGKSITMTELLEIYKKTL